MAAKPTDSAQAWEKAEHEAELMRTARYRAMSLRERLSALEQRSRLLARLKEQREARITRQTKPTRPA